MLHATMAIGNKSRTRFHDNSRNMLRELSIDLPAMTCAIPERWNLIGQ
jgi:hypothetical protein